MSTPALSVKNLTKRYNDYLAVDHLSFELKQGEVLGLLGPNGAGKTTTIQMLLGMTTPDAGEIKYFGQSFPQEREEILNKINYASSYSELQGKITVWENLEIYAGFYNVKNFKSKIEEVLAMFEIEDVAHTTFWKLSSGQQSRSILARAFLNDPKLILMDEPTASLDPEIVAKTLDIIRQVKKEHQTSILYTSHNMEEVSRICDKIMFLKQGRIRVVDTPANITKLVDKSKLVLTFDGTQKEISRVLDQEKLEHEFIAKQLVEIKVDEEDIPVTLFGFRKADVFITQIEIEKPSLEDVFLSIAREQTEEVES